jgi:hypothetical protein
VPAPKIRQKSVKNPPKIRQKSTTIQPQIRQKPVRFLPLQALSLVHVHVYHDPATALITLTWCNGMSQELRNTYLLQRYGLLSALHVGSCNNAPATCLGAAVIGETT